MTQLDDVYALLGDGAELSGDGAELSNAEVAEWMGVRVDRSTVLLKALTEDGSVETRQGQRVGFNGRRVTLYRRPDCGTMVREPDGAGGWVSVWRAKEVAQ